MKAATHARVRAKREAFDRDVNGMIARIELEFDALFTREKANEEADDD